MFDERTVASLYDRYSGELFAYIRGYMRSHESAEDVLHDVFVSLMRYAQTRDIDMETVRALCYRIARTRCIDRLRKSSREEAMDIGEYIPDERESAEGRLIVGEMRERLDALLGKMESAEKEVFFLKRESRLSYAEIALLLGISERTAKRRMRGALDFIADGMAAAGFEIFSTLLLSLLALLMRIL